MSRMIPMSSRDLWQPARAASLSVREFGVRGDGSNEYAGMQAAIDKLKSLGGGRLEWPLTSAGYRTDTPLNLRGLKNAVLDGCGSFITNPTNYAPVFATWWRSSTDQPVAGISLPQQETYYNLTGIARMGKNGLTLASAGDAANFAVGDIVSIRCGDVINTTYAAVDPHLGEYNRLTAISGAALTVLDPFADTYRNLGDGAPFALANFTAQANDNLVIQNFQLHSPKWRAMVLVHLYGFTMRNCLFLGHSGPHLRGRHIDADFRVEQTPDFGLTTPNAHVGGVDCGTTDFKIRCRGRSRGQSQFHIHEHCKRGEVDLEIKRGTVDIGTPPTYWPMISMRSTGRDIRVRARLDAANEFAGGNAGAINIESQSAALLTHGFEGIVLDDVVMRGTIHDAGSTSRYYSINTDNGPLLVRRIDLAACVADSQTNFGTGVIAYGDILTRDVPPTAGAAGNAWALVTGGGAGAAASGTRDGELVIVGTKAASPVAQIAQMEMDVPSGGWTRAMCSFETEVGNNGAGGQNGFFRYFTNAGSAGVSFSTGWASPSGQSATRTLAFGTAGSTRYHRFYVDIGSNGRVGFRINWDVTSGSDAMPTSAEMLFRRGTVWFIR